MTIARRVTGSASSDPRAPPAQAWTMGSSWRCAWTRWSPPSTRSAEVLGGSSCARDSWKEGPPRVWVVKQCVRVPVFVMIRPRGGDFLYSDREVEVMKADIRLAKLHGADGLVFGALTEDGRIDTELCTALLAVCRPLPVTFHRAFDMVHDPLVALETLISLGFERVLTSGCDSSALEGLSLIKRLAEQAKGRIVVMPGGGITERNLQRILEGSTASEFHCSARSARDSGMKFRNPNVAMGASFSAPEYSIKVADVAKVRTLNAIAKNIL
ncbi:copper homeostasis protein cutC homolog isoform X1 [Pithys albifrons albifrons]|uniref:copper homeostasis protein cutC homolog isoform X1 n=1 Tax=Pithys albifrons albifrons TaxID=3385563 RepID=UPI003A5CCC9F